MKVSLIGSDLSRNETGRVYLLAKMLEPHFEVEIAGLTSIASGVPVWSPLDPGEMTYKSVPSTYALPSFYGDARRLMRELRGDVIYAVSMRAASYGVALWMRRTRGIPVILDNVDWEACREPGWPTWRQTLSGAYRVQSHLYCLLMERLHGRADAVTCSNSFLQSRFGGTIIPHAKNTDQLDPAKHDGQRTKRELGLGGRKVVLFMGTPRPHKGVEDLLEAVCRVPVADVSAVIVGADRSDPFVSGLMARYDGAPVRWVDRRPFDELPRILAMADVVAIPQRDEPVSRGQMPSKLYDAMAMAKPIVSTRLCDIPSVMKGCGVVVAPKDIGALASAIGTLLADPSHAAALGRKAREKCVARYDWRVVGDSLRSVVDGVLRHRPTRESAPAAKGERI